MSAKELHAQAWTVVRPYFHKAQQEAVDQYKQFISSGRASNLVRKIILEASHGRIELLFVLPDFQQWGTFDPSTDEIHLHKKEKTGDEDLFEFTATRTLLNGGIVYVVEPENMPDTGSLAAVFQAFWHDLTSSTTLVSYVSLYNLFIDFAHRLGKIPVRSEAITPAVSPW